MMKKHIARLLLICLLVSVVVVAFASCEEESKVRTLYVYNWGEYISDGSDGSVDTNAEFEKYYKEKAAEENADFETIDKNLKAIAAVLGEDISEDLSSWKAELGLNDQQNENDNGN